MEAMKLWFELHMLQDQYINNLDNDRLEAWPTLFTEDCLYEIVPKENADMGLPDRHHLLHEPEDAARPRGVAAQRQYLRGTHLPAHDVGLCVMAETGRCDRDGKQLRRDPDAHGR